MSPPTNDAEETFEELKELRKSAITAKDGILGKHLDDVKLIAKGKAVNTFSADLEGKSEDEILQVFVLAGESSKVAEMQDQVANQWRRMENIFEARARDIAPRYQKLMHLPPVDDNEDETSEDETTDE